DRPEPDGDGLAAGNGRLHVLRAAPGAPGRRAQRPVFLLRVAVRGAPRRAPLRRRDPGGPVDRNVWERPPTAPPGGQGASAALAGVVARAVPGRAAALAVDGGAHRRARGGLSGSVVEIG